MVECKVSTKIANASLLTELVYRIGKQSWTETGAELYNTLCDAQKLEKADREEREATAKAADELAKAAAAVVKPLPCPWCGTQAESFEVMQKWGGTNRFQYNCKNCFASGSMAGTEVEALRAWNTRAGKPQDRRQSGERRRATEKEALLYLTQAPFGGLRRHRRRRATDRRA